MLQQAHVAAEAVGTLSHAGKRVEDAAVELARVGLPGDVVEFAKAEIRRDSAVELVNLIRVPAKERNKARFGARCAPAAQKADGGKRVGNFFQIEKQILHPEAGSAADGHRLCRLKMRVADGRNRFGALGKGLERVEHGADTVLNA